MGVDTAQRAPVPAASGDNQNSTRVPTEAELSSLFDEAMKRPDKAMSRDEQAKFLKAMGDPEFRSLLNDYMQEIADPANRAETEQYLAQLEREQKVPEDKTLIKPQPGFVVKTKWHSDAPSASPKKMFVNICSSEKLQPPSSTKVESGPRVGTSWSLPYSVGPERTEPDKSGERVPTYDVCFHPRTLQFATTQKQYRDMVVKTCLDAVEPLLRKSQGKPAAVVSRDYHVLKGVLYKSGEPVTMCLTTPSGGGGIDKPAKTKSAGEAVNSTVEGTKKPERLEPRGSHTTEDKPTEILHESRTARKPLIEEVTSTTAKPTADVVAPPKPLPKLEFRVVYRGKFEMLDHMQATLNNHETPAQLPNRPRELVVEISFPNHASAKGIDLDVNDRAVKVETAGYQPLEVQLPFAVIEEKGSAKFDKKARKLVVTLPVQPPEPAPVKRMAIVEQDDQEEDEQTTLEPPSVPEEVEATGSAVSLPSEQPRAPKDDAFAMLRETALMVANDPMYLPREPAVVKTEQDMQATQAQTEAKQPVTLEDKVKAHVADDTTYDDLPPLESCSEDEDEIEMDLNDMLAMETPVASRSDAIEETTKSEDATKRDTESRILRQTPSYSIKQTATCISYLLEVHNVDAASVKLGFPSKKSFRIQFSTKQEHFELFVEDVGAEVDENRSEFHVASENVAVILYKASAPVATKVEAIEQLPQTPAPPPVVHFQNDLLYDID